MEIQNLYDETDTDFDAISVSLIRLAKNIADYEFFFQINQLNHLKFARIQDLVYCGEFYDYHFPRFQAYHQFTETCFTFTANQSLISTPKKVLRELFVAEENIKFLLNNKTDVEYILHSSEHIPDFSVILLPENLVFPRQDYTVDSDEEFYQILQYYE